jgi:TrmH family RNA methyltransferase
LIEGLQQVGAAIEAGWELEALLHAPELLTSPFGRQLVSCHAGRLEEVSAPVFQSIAEKENPQGIVAIARQRHLKLEGITPRGCSVALVCPQDPGNVGAILRTLDAVGGSALYLLDGGVDPYHPTAIRASMGAAFTIPVVEAGFGEFQIWRKEHRIQLIGSSAASSTDYGDVRPESPWALLMGSEQKGLSENQKRACDATVSLPMRGRITSLNLAVAAGILLFAYLD